ncbi:PaaI family thioesterase [Actinospongicola halichondriae]|uniref:PaaI family thioesterase n=1 Tax=Actinospongicola halichondriae TaxID=3236844 RepID=UPI003D4F80FE
MADDALTSLAHDQMPFTAGLGLRIDRGTPEEVVASADWQADRCTAGGILHGGYLMALADAVGAMCAFQHLPPGSVTSTIESKSNFFRGVASGAVTITSTPIHTGRTTIVVQTDITRDDGKHVSRTTQTQAVIPLG